MTKFVVVFDDDDFGDCSEVYFETYDEASHYARLNAGCVINLETGELIEKWEGEK